jgi:hypothetical protein
MTEPLKPREGCAWTDARVEQFETLRTLLNSVGMLNSGSNFLGNARSCIDLANKLRVWSDDWGTASFISFLHEQIIEDRFGKDDK